MNPMLSRQAALLLFAVVVAVWGSNWAVTKIVVQSVSPLWASAIRSAIATVALLALLLARGQLALPRRGDVPVILATPAEVKAVHQLRDLLPHAFDARFLGR